MELAEIARLASATSVPAVVAAGTYFGVRALILLTALYGPERHSRRAREVLRLLRRDHGARR